MRGWFPAAVIPLLIACESNAAPPAPSPGNGMGEVITGRERVGWDQAASDGAELAGFRFVIYVDNARSELADVTCGGAAGPSGFPCSARLPALAPGSHVLEIASVNGGVESTRSTPLRVTVAGAASPAAQAPLASGDVVTASDGARLTAERVLDNLADVSDIVVSPSGSLLIAERAGAIVIGAPGSARPVFRVETGAPVLALSPSPDFARTGHLFVVHHAGGAVRLTRYRLFGTQLVDRMPIIPDVAASREPAAALRFGPDTKLYAAFDATGQADAAQRMSDWRGKVLRLNPDGRTPDDQPAGSPVYWSGLASPRAIAWSRDGMLWMAERGADGVERLRAIAADEGRPKRTGQKASYVLPGQVGASSLAFHHGNEAPPFSGNLFVAAREGQYLLRIVFDETDRLKAMTSEKLLEGRIGDVRAVVVAPDGALYVASSTSVWRLTPIRN